MDGAGHTEIPLGLVSIEKAILLDVCLGVPLGRLAFRLPRLDETSFVLPPPPTFLFGGEQLAYMKSLYIQGGESVLVEAVRKLEEAAEAAMLRGPFSVTEKPSLPEGVQPNDYYSPAKYWWPDTGTASGLPYVRRDGEINPACYSSGSDYPRLVDFSETVVLLSLAAYLSGRHEFAERAFNLVEFWFLDHKTMQTPHFRFAQRIEGRTGLRGQGLIEARHLVYVTEAILLLESVAAVPTAEQARLRSWFGSLLEWLSTSEEGQSVGAASNNIGFWYDLQRMVFANFVGDRALVERIVRTSATLRMESQIAEDGSLPAELQRARPEDYVAFTLVAMALISRAGTGKDVPLWTYRQSDGRNFQAAQDWLTKAYGTYRKLVSEAPEASASSEEMLAALLDAGLQARALDRIAALRQVDLEKVEAREKRIQSRRRSLLTTLKAAQKEIESLRPEKEHLEAAVEILRAEAAGAQSAQDLLQAEADALKRNTKLLGKKLKELRDYSALLERKHLDILESRSWTASEPLRRVARRVFGKKPPVPFVPRFVSRGTPNSLKDQASRLASRIGRAIVPGKKEAAARAKVRQLKCRLLNLGYAERAYQDLRALFENAADKDQRRLAGFELAVWHANRYTPADAELCLDLLAEVESAGVAPEMTRQIAVLSAESLDVLGRPEEALAVLERAGTAAPHADLYLAQCHLQGSDRERLAVLNRAFDLCGLGRVRFLPEGQSLYDRLAPAGNEAGAVALQGVAPKVTVIVPVFNAEATIETTLRSLCAQTWANVEILVSDDCSTDGTAAVVEGFARNEPRLRLIRGEGNSGPYVARNLALREATGTYVTCNDADDWSHPEKIERQVRHLMAAPDVVANTSQQARAMEDLRMFRRGNPGFYLQLNMSSLMFRREAVLDEMGYWDSVRFAADSEFLRRLKQVFGQKAVIDLETGPLSFQRQTSGSLTASSAFGYGGFKMGARKVYDDTFKEWHARQKRPRIDFPLTARPFPVPEPMRPVREVSRGGRRRFDVVLVSDFRMPGGTSMSNIEEIKAQHRLGLRTGLVQMGRYDLNPARPLNPGITRMIDGDRIDLLVKGEAIECGLLVLRLPWILEEFQAHVPEVAAQDIRVIVNQPPKRDYAPASPYIYHLQRCLAHLKRQFGSTGTWHPIGPLVRQALIEHHSAELEGIPLSPEDWPNIIDLDDWQRPLPPLRETGRIRICRHSRDQYVKWPADRETLLKAYPDASDIEIHVLGGAETPQALLGGRLPPNWHVTAFGKKEPAAFLADFDVFVYYTHPAWVESFGRVIFEAMAVGLPVFLPPVYRPLFGMAAIYAEPDDLESRVRALMADPQAYKAQVACAQSFVRERFGYSCHARRIGAILGTDLTPRLRDDPLARGSEAISGDRGTPLSWDTAALAADISVFRKSEASGAGRLIAGLVEAAEDALARGPYSVVDKTSLPPSGNRHDYWHPAPYWWPNPNTANGLPYVRRDGARVPGTLMYGADNERYDRTRIQQLFDDSTILTLAWQATGRHIFARKAVENLECFFVDPSTRMTPHLEYAQVKLGHNNNRGSSSGIIELKDFYYYLDAVRLLTANRILLDSSAAAFRNWLESYLRWLLKSRQGRSEAAATNNHGTYYDLQVAAIASFLDLRVLLTRTFRRARERLAIQFTAEGAQPEELRRTTTAHYCCYNLQGWINLARLAARWGVDLWSAEGPGGIRPGASWLIRHAGQSWPYSQIEPFDEERFFPLWHMLPSEHRPERPAAVPPDVFAIKPIFHPHDGIRPYWNLGLAT